MHRTILATGHVVLVGKPGATGGPPPDRPPLAGMVTPAIANPATETELDGALACTEEVAREYLRQGFEIELNVGGLRPTRPRDVLELGLECAALQAAGRHLLRIGQSPTIRLLVREPERPAAMAA